MECTFTNWEKRVILRALKVHEAVEKNIDKELTRFRENEDGSDPVTVKAYCEMKSAFMDLLEKLEELTKY